MHSSAIKMWNFSWWWENTMLELQTSHSGCKITTHTLASGITLLATSAECRY